MSSTPHREANPGGRPWLQFNLRIFLLLTLALGTFLGWLGMRLTKYQAQREATEQIEMLGGNVEWLPRSFPQIDTPTRVTLRETQFRDADLTHLYPMHELAWLSLAKTKVSDAGVEKLSHFRNLVYLDLSGTSITPAALRSLEQFVSLRRVNLAETNLTDQAVERLQAKRPDLRIEH